MTHVPTDRARLVRRSMLVAAVMASSLGLLGASLRAQDAATTEPTTAPTTAPTTQAIDVNDAVNYMIGMQIANQLKIMNDETGVVDLARVQKAIADTFNGVEPLYTDEQLQTALMQFQTDLSAKREAERQAKLADSLAKSTAFLEENAKRAEVTTTESGLQFETLTEGTGATPAEGDAIRLHYRGTLIDGTEFDNSRDPRRSGEPVTFDVTEGSLIEGFIEALKLTKVGGKYKVYIPPALGFGELDTGDIPANSTLIFEIEPVEVLPPEPPATQEATDATDTTGQAGQAGVEEVAPTTMPTP